MRCRTRVNVYINKLTADVCFDYIYNFKNLTEEILETIGGVLSQGIKNLKRMKRGKHVFNCQRKLPEKQRVFHPHFSFTGNAAALFSCFKPELQPLWHFSLHNKPDAHFIPLERLIY